MAKLVKYNLTGNNMSKGPLDDQILEVTSEVEIDGTLLQAHKVFLKALAKEIAICKQQQAELEKAEDSYNAQVRAIYLTRIFNLIKDIFKITGSQVIALEEILRK